MDDALVGASMIESSLVQPDGAGIDLVAMLVASLFSREGVDSTLGGGVTVTFTVVEVGWCVTSWFGSTLVLTSFKCSTVLLFSRE